MEKVTRESILLNAKKYISNDRNTQYGEPEDNFSVIAKYWSLWLGKEINAHDVAMMMSLFKVARIHTGVIKYDSYEDLAGYVACAGEIVAKNNKTKSNN